MPTFFQGTCKVITVFSTLLANPKFNSAIWQLEQARMFLLLSGFEQVHLQASMPIDMRVIGE